MVLTIEGRFSYNTYVGPIKLVNTSTSSENYGQCTHSGYGYTQIINNNPGTTAHTLQWITVQCIRDSDCKKVWPSATITERQQCADAAGVSCCMGDSGGPLTIRQGSEDRLLGNASWASNKCNVNNFPQVYSRNSAPAIHSWIKQMAGI